MVIIFIVYECVMCIFIIYTLLQKELEAANCMYSFIPWPQHAISMPLQAVISGPFHFKNCGGPQRAFVYGGFI